jgi:Heterokaryon incompatibility protein (HET)
VLNSPPFSTYKLLWCGHIYIAKAAETQTPESGVRIWLLRDKPPHISTPNLKRNQTFLISLFDTFISCLSKMLCQLCCQLVRYIAYDDNPVYEVSLSRDVPKGERSRSHGGVPCQNCPKLAVFMGLNCLGPPSGITIHRTKELVFTSDSFSLMHYGQLRAKCRAWVTGTGPRREIFLSSEQAISRTDFAPPLREWDNRCRQILIRPKIGRENEFSIGDKVLLREEALLRRPDPDPFGLGHQSFEPFVLDHQSFEPFVLGHQSSGPFVLGHQSSGPFEIIDRIDFFNYRLRLPKGKHHVEELHDREFFHVTELKRQPEMRKVPAVHELSDTPISSNSGSTQSIEWLKTRLNECRCDHHNCLRSQVSCLPDRVLDLYGGATENEIRLMEFSHSFSDYVALSYCWGPPDRKPNLTTVANLGERKSKIMMGELVKCFQDAVHITRALGIRYLWIDSLCILQDSDVDFATQAQKMSKIYENAILTIAASCTSDSHTSFLRPREREPSKFEIPMYRNEFNTSRDQNFFESLEEAKHFGLDQRHVGRMMIHLERRDEGTNLPLVFDSHWGEPIQKRGWTLQERFLSPSIIFFDRGQLLWECTTHRQLESSALPLDTYWNDIFDCKFFVAKRLLRKPQKRSEDKSKLQDLWYDVLDIFGRRCLTHGNDALPAMSGVAKAFARALDDDYMAGLWRKDLVRGLVWWIDDQNSLSSSQGRCSQRDLHAISQSLIAPSWSWASIYRNQFNTDGSLTLNGCAVRTYRHFKSDFDAHLIAVETAPLFDDPFSQLKLGRLTIRGLSRRARVFFPRFGRSSIGSKPRDATTTTTEDNYLKNTPLFERDLQIEFESGKTPHNHLYLDNARGVSSFLKVNLASNAFWPLECLFLSTWSPGENIISRPFQDKLGISDLRSYCLLLRPSSQTNKNGVELYERCGLLRLDLPWHSDGSSSMDMSHLDGNQQHLIEHFFG